MDNCTERKQGEGGKVSMLSRSVFAFWFYPKIYHLICTSGVSHKLRKYLLMLWRLESFHVDVGNIMNPMFWYMDGSLWFGNQHAISNTFFSNNINYKFLGAVNCSQLGSFIMTLWKQRGIALDILKFLRVLQRWVWAVCLSFSTY